MKTRFLIVSIFILFFSTAGNADQGVSSVQSVYDVNTTADRLEAILQEKGMKIFNRINHGKGAQSVGVNLRPTELIIFGNPKVGAPLMQCAQTVALDLPQKALIWEDESGKVWLSYNDPAYLVERHNISGCEEVVQKVTNALANFAKSATE